MNRWTMSVVATFLLALAVVVWGEPPPRERPERGDRPAMDHPRGPRGDGDMARRAGLSDEEAARVREMRYQSARRAIELRSQLELKRLEMQHLMEQDEPDEDAIMSSLEEAARLQLKMQKQRVKQQLEMRRIVGPEKFKQVQKIQRRAMSERRGGGREMDRPGRKGSGGKEAPWMKDRMRPPEE